MHRAAKVFLLLATAFYAVADDCKPPNGRELSRVAGYLSWRIARSYYEQNVPCCEMEFTRINNTIYLHAVGSQAVILLVDMDPSVEVSEFSLAGAHDWKDQVVRFANPQIPSWLAGSSPPNTEPFIVCRWPRFTMPRWKPLAKSARPAAFNAIRRALGLQNADNAGFVADVITFNEHDPYIVGVISRVDGTEKDAFWLRFSKTADRWTFFMFRHGFENDLPEIESRLANKGSWRVQ